MLDVIVLTAFDREAWLIQQLEKNDVSFVAIDVTTYFKSTNEKFTVPFGMSLDSAQEEILKCGYVFNKQLQGWSLISDRGVVETNGFLKEHQRQLRGELAQKIFAHQMSTYDYPYGILSGSVQPLTYDYSTYETVCSSKTVVVEKEIPLTIRIRDGGQFINYKNEVYKSPYLINLLDPYLCSELQKKGVDCNELVQARSIDPLYLWYPFKVVAQQTEHISHMPKQTVVVSAIDKPWLEQNFIILNKEAMSGDFMAWMPIVFDMKNNANYILDVKQGLLAVLGQELKLTDITIKDHFVSLRQGVSPYPIYDHSEIQLFKKWYDRGVFNCGFEVCDSFELDEQVRVQRCVVNGLLQERERDRKIHS